VTSEPGFSEGRIQLGLHLIRTQRLTEAEQQFRAVVELEPRNRIAWNNIGVIHLRVAAAIRDPQTREEAFDQALETFNTIIERFPSYAKGYGNRAKIYILRRQFPLAVADLQKALELDPEYEDAKAQLAALRGRTPRK
jgi:tetratricopeptide (TPR) repeat protein